MSQNQNMRKIWANHFYPIEKIQKIVKENGILKGVVKWVNYQNCTKQPLDYLKSLRTFSKEIDVLEEEYEQDHNRNIIHIKTAVGQYLQQYRSTLFPHQSIENTSSIEKKQGSEKKSHEKGSHGRKQKVSIEEQVRCKLIAQQKMLKKIQYGLRDLNAKDYYYFIKLRSICQDEVNFMMKMNSVPKTNYLLQKIKGIQRCQNSEFQYTVLLSSKVYVCSTEQMRQKFPIHLLNYLNYLTRYMKTYMSQEIEQQQKRIKKRRYKQNAVNALRQTINIKDKIDSKQNPIYFGYNLEDAQKNRKADIGRFMGKNQYYDQNLNESKNNNEKIKDFYTQMVKSIKQIKLETKIQKEGENQQRVGTRSKRRNTFMKTPTKNTSNYITPTKKNKSKSSSSHNTLQKQNSKSKSKSKSSSNTNKNKTKLSQSALIPKEQYLPKKRQYKSMRLRQNEIRRLKVGQQIADKKIQTTQNQSSHQSYKNRLRSRSISSNQQFQEPMPSKMQKK